MEAILTLWMENKVLQTGDGLTVVAGPTVTVIIVFILTNHLLRQTFNWFQLSTALRRAILLIIIGLSIQGLQDLSATV